MNNSHKNLPVKKGLFFLISVGMVTVLNSLTSLTFAQINLLTQQRIPTPENYVYVPDPSNSNPNYGRETSGTMGEGHCKTPRDGRKQNLFFFVPKYSNQGLILSSKPTFWVYLPYQSDNTVDVELNVHLLEEDGTESASIYQKKVKDIKTPGIVPITVQSSETDLDINQNYKVKFLTTCQKANGSPLRQKLDGNIKRITSDSLPSPYQTVWLEQLTKLATSRCNKPIADTDKEWQSFLTLVNLDFLADEPILTCPNQS